MMDNEALFAYFSEVRKDFPLLMESSVLYCDNAATTQKPKRVIDRVHDFSQRENANVHRGLYTLSEQATAAYEGVRDRLVRFMDANQREEIIFTSGTTESLNLIAFGLEPFIEKGDEILLSVMEHHANLVPWQELARIRGANLRFISLGDDYRLPEDITPYLTNRTKVLAFPHISNVLGSEQPVSTLVEQAKAKGIITVVDGAQGAGHLPVSVREMDCDFYVFSGHKLYAPTGVGVLYGRYSLLRQLRPRRFGGEMIYEVGWKESTYLEPPAGLEGGTPPIAEVIGLGEAIKYLQEMDMETVARYEYQLTRYFLEQIQSVEDVELYGPHSPEQRAPVFSFAIAGVHAHDVSAILNLDDIAVRAGHHCAMPLMGLLGVSATARASFSFYNTMEEVDRLIAALQEVKVRHHRGDSLLS